MTEKYLKYNKMISNLNFNIIEIEHWIKEFGENFTLKELLEYFNKQVEKIKILRDNDKERTN